MSVLEWCGKVGFPSSIVIGLMWWGYKMTPELFKYLRERDAVRAKTEMAWNELAGRLGVIFEKNTTAIEKVVAVIERSLEKRQ